MSIVDRWVNRFRGRNPDTGKAYFSRVKVKVRTGLDSLPTESELPIAGTETTVKNEQPKKPDFKLTKSDEFEAALHEIHLNIPPEKDS